MINLKINFCCPILVIAYFFHPHFYPFSKGYEVVLIRPDYLNKSLAQIRKTK